MLTVILGIAVCLMMTLPAAGAPEKPELYRQGQEVFTANCADCHRSNGEGLPGTIPSLAKSAFVTGDPGPVIEIILEGRKAKIGQMPSWKNSLTDQQIAGAVTYLRQSWGNQAEAVTPEMVAKKRRQ